ncbi:AAA-domain-containing protein [Gyrodon lividus]|nr:AAA-domain-containing protein [Gyrodon lividus]
MSFFFCHVPSADANFAVKSPSDTAGEDTVLLAQGIWNSLCSSDESRIAVSIRPKRQYPTGLRLDSVHNLTCWAACDPAVSEIAIPPSWLVNYPDIFQPFKIGMDDGFKPVIISVATHISLTEIILSAKTEAAYLMALTHGSVLENWFFDTSVIFRDGKDISLPSNIFPTNGNALQRPSIMFYSYRVSLAFPYKQGIAQRRSTRFIVASSRELDTASEFIEDADVLASKDSLENLEISESFLISATLSPPGHSSRVIEIVQSPEASFFLKALHTPVDYDLDEATLYIRTCALRPLGMLNGDWVLASHVDLFMSRMVRICALDDPLLDPRYATLSPTLLHNLCPSGLKQIVVSASPFGARDSIRPTARSITLARVASPFSTDRRYESLFINALHSYFGSSTRLVRDGDVIPLCINIDHALDPHQSSYTGTFSASISHNSSEVLVYFIVRNVEHANTNLGGHGFPSTLLNVGCFVDTSVTKIVQVGIEQAGVPDVSEYYGFRRASLTTSSGFLTAASGVADQISRLSNAMSLEGASSFDVQATIFVAGARGAGKFSTAIWIARQLRMHLVEINCFDVISDSDVKTAGLLRERAESAISCAPCVLVLRHIDALNQLTPNAEPGEVPTILQALQQSIDNAMKICRQQCIVVATSESGRAPNGVSFINEMKIKALNEEERFHLLSEQLHRQGAPVTSDVSIMALAVQTAALVASDLENLVKQTRIYALSQACTNELAAEPALSAKYFEANLLKARAVFAQNINAPSIPTVLWEDVGGLAQVKHEILDTVQLPLDHPELFQDGLKKRSGVLLYGPPGTGKTLLAKAVATSCSLNFFSVKGPELLNMYIGESEANVRRVFQRARDAKPCVIFFDELDSIAPKRGNQGDSGGVMDRIVSQLLAELDGMSMGGADVFVIGATNRPDLLDPALLRPGRFDRMLYLGVSNTHEAQLDILRALTRKFNLHPSLSLSAIAASCPFNYTGADFYALCADALLHALSHKVDELERQRAQLNTLPEFHHHPISPQFFIAEMVSASQLQLVVSSEDFLQAVEELVPSISQSELSHYALIQQYWSS